MSQQPGICEEKLLNPLPVNGQTNPQSPIAVNIRRVKRGQTLEAEARTLRIKAEVKF